MSSLLDWVKQTVSGTPGTGDITLSTAVAGYIGLQGNVVDGAAIKYVITDGTDLERGVGIYTASGTTLTRAWVQAKIVSGVYSENPGTGLNLTSAAIVSCVPVADTHNFKGALVYHSATQSIPTSVSTALLFNSEVYDTNNFHDNVTNNSRLTIPANSGIRKVKLYAGLRVAPNTSGYRQLYFGKNTGESIGTMLLPTNPTGVLVAMNMSSPVIDCTDSDYFTVLFAQNSGGALNVNDGLSQYFHYFALEVVE